MHNYFSLICSCMKHHNLVITSVTGIPMKEEANSTSSSNYDVALLHPRMPTTSKTRSLNAHPYSRFAIQISLSTFKCIIYYLVLIFNILTFRCGHISFTLVSPNYTKGFWNGKFESVQHRLSSFSGGCQ